MSASFRRALVLAIAVLPIVGGPFWVSGGLGAAVFAPRPGPIERPRALAVADFDRDGRDDIVVADFQAGVLEVLIGRADGTFAPLPSSPFGVGIATISQVTSGPIQLVVTDLEPGDVDGDAVPNVLDDCPNVYNPKDATGRQFDNETAAGPDQICNTADDHIAQYGPDGLCGGTNPDDLTGDGVGEACEAGTDTDGNDVVDVTVDTDGDGVLDYDPTTLRLDNCPHLPNPGQEDTETAKGPDGLCGTADDHHGQYGTDGLCGTADDRVGDGVGDACATSPDLLVLVLTHTTGTTLGALRVRLNDGEGGFVTRSSYLTGAGPGSMTVADFTKDGRPDVAIASTAVDLVQILPGTADGNFGAQTFLNAGDGAQGTASADLDGDGDIDLAVANHTAGTLSIFLNNAGAFAINPNATVPTLPAPAVLLAGNLDGDPYGDLVVLEQGATGAAGRIEVFRGAAGGTPTQGQLIALGIGSVPIAGLLRDLNGDGHADLAVADFPGRQVLLFAGVGDGTFTPAGSFAVAGQPTSLATIDLPVGGAGSPDLAVLEFDNRLDLFVNGGVFIFSPDVMNPVSAFGSTSAMALFGADTNSGVDLVLLQSSPASFTTLSGIGDGSFRITPSQTIEGLAGSTSSSGATSMLVGDVRLNNRPDLLLLDPGAGRFTLLSNELTGTMVEHVTTTIAPGAAGLYSGAILSSTADIDRDGIPNDEDDCPTVYNPPGCKVSDAACAVTIPCAVAGDPEGRTPIDCTTTDPTTGQCDSDENGIGDHCQVLSENCAAQDSDFDLISDYSPDAIARSLGELDFDRDSIANTVDNCPTIANNNQADSNGRDDGDGIGDACEVLDSAGAAVDPDADGVPTYDPVTHAMDNCPAVANPSQKDNNDDGVGNACMIRAALDNCPVTINLNQADANGDGVGDQCAVPPLDVLVPNPATNEVLLLAGDGTGALHPAAASPLSGLAGPVGAAAGHFALECALATFCLGRPENDLAVVERGDPGDPGDDQVTVFVGDGGGGFTPLPAEPVAGNPTGVILAADQSICPLPRDPANPFLTFDPDTKSDMLVIPEPGSDPPGIGRLLVSNQNRLDPAKSSLIPPVAQPDPLPVTGPLRGAVMIDANRDGRTDMVALSSPPGGPSHLTLFMGLGNGLFYTDPTLDPADLPAELDFPTSGFINIKTDSIYPDLALFNVTDRTPLVLLNTLTDRADIDRSGRVDGKDLVYLARAFGATRGQDFTLLPGAIFNQTGSGPTRVLVGTGAFVPGQNLPDTTGFCSTVFEPLAGLYGLPVDINLDGVVDGVDLALLASRFGVSVTP